jgi:bifunctional UDP-N-acetylglucosamine pyrophosphorylase/glucosamine-1-phosphate N-acetyltransferase
VFIGTNNSLVAPIKIGQGATTGAGSTLTRNVAEHSLAVERSKQFEKANYQRPQKLKK